MELADIIGVNEGNPCYIFGKGPGLAEWIANDEEREYGKTIGINQSAFTMKTDYFMAYDYRYLKSYMPVQWSKHMVALCPPVVCNKTTAPHDLRCEYIGSDNIRIMHNPVHYAKKGIMYRGSGTISSAVWAAYLMGSSLIRMVGIDGGGGYRIDYQGGKTAIPSSDDTYYQLREGALRVARLLGIPVQAYTPKWSLIPV